MNSTQRGEVDWLPVAVLRIDGEFVTANQTALALFEVETGDGVLDALLDEDRRALLGVTVATGEGPAGDPVRVDLRSAAGPPRRFFSATVARHPDGGAAVVVVESTDEHRLDTAMAEMATGIYVADADLRGVWMPARIAGTLGLTPDEFFGVDVYDLIHPDDVSAARSLVERSKAMPGVTYRALVRIFHPLQPDGPYPVLVRTIWLPGDDAIGGLLVRFDTGQLDPLDERQTATDEGTLTLRDAIPVGVLNLRVDGAVVHLNSRLRELLRPLAGDLDGARWMDLVHPEDRPAAEAARAAAAAGTFPAPIEVGLVGRGQRLWVRLDIVPYRNLEGEVNGMFVTLLDLTAERLAQQAAAEAEAELWWRAHHDALTNLPNRTLLLDRLDTRLRLESDAKVPSVALLVCDLDGFKAVNDEHGHRHGDGVLVEAAARLDAAARDGDLVCRYGGDEFLVLCEDADREAVVDVASRMVAALGEPVVSGGHEHLLGVSIGIAFARPGEGDEEIVRRADRAMYRAKEAGGGRVAVDG